MNNLITILKDKIALTPYHFYTNFLYDVADVYLNSSDNIEFKLFENGDEKIYDSNYRVDPITIPLLLSLFEQLSKFHNQPLKLFLYNNNATKDVLGFLDRADFFKISGSEDNYIEPRGRNILSFNQSYLGAYRNRNQRSEHKVRAYSLIEEGLSLELDTYATDEDKRDFLSSHYTYKVKEHFSELLFENEFTYRYHNIFIDVLAELITNGVLHSKSNTFALMFSDRFKTKFSISDNGIGLQESMSKKKSTFYYEPNFLTKKISINVLNKEFNNKIINNLFSIFETLYYSSLKDREGLFDLMINVVLKSNGYFRLHNDNCQIIISNRMMDQLLEVEELRKNIVKTHKAYYLDQIDDIAFKEKLTKLSVLIRDQFVVFYNTTIEKYNNDVKYSSIRFFKVRFKGVHIEVEIPNI